VFQNSLKQGNAGLGQAIAYFTNNGYGVCIPLTDSEDWDLIVSKNSNLFKVQVKTSGQLDRGSEKFEINVKGGNNGKNPTCKDVTMQDWDMIFLYHIGTGLKALVPKDKIQVKHSITFGKSMKYNEFIIVQHSAESKYGQGLDC
jgi:hypothetical protein